MSRREVSPFLKKLRNLYRGSPVVETLRFSDDLSTRDPPPPNVPGGPYHRSSKTYYFTRDARREVLPPIDLQALKQIEAEKSAASTAKSIAPGKVYLYDHNDYDKPQ